METLLTDKPEVAASAVAQAGPDTVAEHATTVSPVDWAQHIPSEYRQDKIWETTFKGKDLSDVLKSTAEAQKLIGSSIRLPNEKDKPDERARKIGAIYDQLGRPKTSEDYGPLRPQNIGDHVEWDADFENGFKTAAHKLGLNKEQAAGVTSAIGEWLNTQMPNPEVQMNQTRKALLTEWGEHGYAQNMTYANRAIESYGGKEFIELLGRSGLGNDPIMARVFAKIGRELAEAGAISGEINIGNAKSEIEKIFSDKTHAYFNRQHPDHESAVARMLDLQRSTAVEQGEG